MGNTQTQYTSAQVQEIVQRATLGLQDEVRNLQNQRSGSSGVDCLTALDRSMMLELYCTIGCHSGLMQSSIGV